MYFGGKPVTGKIDQLLELDNGLWAVIDYKSEAAGPEGYTALSEENRKSMEIYCKAAGDREGGSCIFVLHERPGNFCR